MEEKSKKAVSIAYVVSRYPMLSMIFVLREVVYLRGLGFDVHVVSINSSDRRLEDLSSGETEEFKKTYYLKEHGVSGALIALIKTLFTNPLGTLRGIKLIFKLSGFDIRKIFFNTMYLVEGMMVGVWMKKLNLTNLHAHLGSQPATVAMFVKAIFGYGYSITVHGSDEFYDIPGQFIEEKIKTADFICCISKFTRSQLMKFSTYDLWGKLEVSRLGVDVDTFLPIEPESDPEIIEILSVARLVPPKGLHILVESLAELIEVGVKVRLRLVGDGEDRASLEKQINDLKLSEFVIFEGAVDQDQIRELYSRAQIFCLPSFAEGIPVVLMEAMAMGIPCVTTHITGIPELIRHAKDGLLVTPSCSSELKAALLSLIEDPVLRKEIGKSARQRIVDQYDISQNVQYLGSIFQKRLNQL